MNSFAIGCFGGLTTSFMRPLFASMPWDVAIVTPWILGSIASGFVAHWYHGVSVTWPYIGVWYLGHYLASVAVSLYMSTQEPSRLAKLSPAANSFHIAMLVFLDIAQFFPFILGVGLSYCIQ